VSATWRSVASFPVGGELFFFQRRAAAWAEGVLGVAQAAAAGADGLAGQVRQAPLDIGDAHLLFVDLAQQRLNAVLRGLAVLGPPAGIHQIKAAADLVKDALTVVFQPHQIQAQQRLVFFFVDDLAGAQRRVLGALRHLGGAAGQFLQQAFDIVFHKNSSILGWPMRICL